MFGTAKLAVVAVDVLHVLGTEQQDFQMILEVIDSAVVGDGTQSMLVACAENVPAAAAAAVVVEEDRVAAASCSKIVLVASILEEVSMGSISE